MMRIALALCMLLLASTPSMAQLAAVQVSDDQSFGRVAISIVSTAATTLRQHGTRIDVTVPADIEVATPDNVPRNVVSMVGGRGTATLIVLPGAHLKWNKEKRTLILRVLDPPARAQNSTLALSSHANPSKPPAAAPVLDALAKPAPSPTSAAGTVAEVPKAPSAPPPAVTEASKAPPAPTATEAKPQAEPEHATAEPPHPPEPAHPTLRAFTVNAGADVGLASFRRGGLGVVIFDDRVTLADAGGEKAILSPAIQLIQRGTLMTVPLAGDENLAVTRSEGALTVAIAAPTGSAAATTASATGVRFQVTKPGRVMAVSDSVSGQTMLIGTTRQTDGEHARVDIGRSAPGYVLLPTWLGVALETSSDQIDLKASLSGYSLEIADKSATNATAAAAQENQFSIPVSPTPVLLRQLSAQMASAAAAPPRGRGPDRVAAARTMLALGMSAEAEALLGLAAADDPAIARDPNTAALMGVAAVLAGRPGDASGLDNPALPTGGDIALWRGLRDVNQGRAAPALAGAWPLLSAYPEAVRRQIAPAVLEAAAANGADVPAPEMEGPSLGLARALKLAQEGQIEPALAALAAVRDSRDERDSVRAAIAATELKLRLGQSTPAEAAEQLERQTVRWRGDGQELALRLRVVALRTQAGQWRTALDGMRQTEAVFPEAKVQIGELKAGLFRALLSEHAPEIAPLEMVLMAGEFADSLPDGADGERLAGLLADKLAALDLPSRAIPVLQKLFDKANSPATKAEFALRLGQMQIDAGDPAKAETLLSSLDMSGTAAGREEQRTVLLARAKAARGDFAGAATTLLTVSTPDADAMRASFYAKAGDWQRSLETLESIVTTNIPETGDLDDKQQDLVLREVTAAVQAGDGETLKRLKRFERRITPPRADLFRVLTASAVKSPEDLPRAARELAMSRTLPDRLNALKLR